MDYDEEGDILQTESEPKYKKCRNLTGFWLLGLCNNYSYVIMLSAAYDILHPEFHSNNGTDTEHFSNLTRQCNPTSTGAILLADILPGLTTKILAPFIAIGFHFRLSAVISLAALSFILTSLSISDFMSYLGVVSASISSAIGEITCLSLASHFDKNVVSTWSSGTGGAGVVGSFSYAALTAKNMLTPRTTLQVMLVIPILMAFVFWILIVHPEPLKPSCCKRGGSCTHEMDKIGGQRTDIGGQRTDSDLQIQRADEMSTLKTYTPTRYTLKTKIALIRPLLKYMIPLGLVYFAEYFINQGLFELLYFDNINMEHKEQYRWYQVIYQVGVLISRSSVNFVRIRKLWILPVLQIINAVFLLLAVYYLFLPSFWIVFVIVLYEGLLGGSAYVNTFYSIREEIAPEHKEASMGIASMGDGFGIACAGFLSLPVHDALCKLPP